VGARTLLSAPGAYPPPATADADKSVRAPFSLGSGEEKLPPAIRSVFSRIFLPCLGERTRRGTFQVPATCKASSEAPTGLGKQSRQGQATEL